MLKKTAKLLWLTGLAGSGKTTIGKKVYKLIKEKEENTVFLDGDSFREIIGSEVTGHSLKDRLINAYRIARMCKFLIEQDINVVCSTMSLFKEIHDFNRSHIKNYYEVFLEVDFNELVSRDQKGLYSKAIKGETKDVVGVDLPYDKPENPTLIINNTNKEHLQANIEAILKLLETQS